MTPEKHKPIVFFDGECAVCNRFVSFLLKKDKKDIFVFCGLASDYAVKTLPQEVQKIDSIIIEINGSYFVKSKAIIKIFETLGGRYNLLSFLMKIFPSRISDYSYTLFAKKRNQIHVSCNLELQKEFQHKILT